MMELSVEMKILEEEEEDEGKERLMISQISIAQQCAVIDLEVRQKFFECVVCLCLIQEARHCQDCLVLFCAKHVGHELKDCCPSCQTTPMTLQPNPVVDKIIQQLPRCCPYASRGCRAMVAEMDFRVHVKTCEWKNIPFLSSSPSLCEPSSSSILTEDQRLLQQALECRSRDRLTEALPLLRKALSVAHLNRGQHSPEYWRIVLHLSDTLKKLNLYQEALTILDQAQMRSLEPLIEDSGPVGLEAKRFLGS